jgi:phosphate transport system substrate-binding protein
LTVGLRPLEEGLHACASANPEIALFLEEKSASSLELLEDKLSFRLGQPLPSLSFEAPIGAEQIIIILNQGNPITNLSSQDINDLFSGKIMNWQEINGINRSVQIWIYPEGDDVGSIFDAVVFHGYIRSAETQIAPDPQAMLEAVAEDVGAIGYLPKAWMATSQNAQLVKQAKIDDGLMEMLHQPILALSTGRPGPAEETLLACLQGGQGQKAIIDLYEPWQP